MDEKSAEIVFHDLKNLKLFIFGKKYFYNFSVVPFGLSVSLFCSKLFDTTAIIFCGSVLHTH